MHQDGHLADHGYGERDISALFILKKKLFGRGEACELGVTDWPIWTKEASQFPWSYGASETCNFLEGDVIVTPDGGEPVAMGEGDLVTFPSGMSCTWEIRKDVRKHHSIGD